jgi:hypothetical protein
MGIVEQFADQDRRIELGHGAGKHWGDDDRA